MAKAHAAELAEHVAAAAADLGIEAGAGSRTRATYSIGQTLVVARRRRTAEFRLQSRCRGRRGEDARCQPVTSRA